MCLYYNVQFSAVYLLFAALNLWAKAEFQYRSQLNRALVTPILALWAVAEIARLWFGFSGNVNEKVPEMSAFLLVTIFPQMPALFYLTLFQEHRMPWDRICGPLQIAMLFVELVVGGRSLQNLIRRQTAQFYRLCQEELR